MSSMYVNGIAEFFRSNASAYINHKAPTISKEIVFEETDGNWYSGEIREVKKIMGR